MCTHTFILFLVISAAQVIYGKTVRSVFKAAYPVEEDRVHRPHLPPAGRSLLSLHSWFPHLCGGVTTDTLWGCCRG